jgi:hypothetical protein
MRPCIFCGAPADSKEHLWADWIIKLVALKNYAFRETIMGRPSRVNNAEAIKLPCVCQTCNNTWMSGLETTAKKFMAKMIVGKNHHLSRQEQQTLTEWCLKTSMCLDSVEDHELFYTQAERSAFRSTARTIPKTTLVWASRCNVKGLMSDGNNFDLKSNGARGVDAATFTMQAGQLVVQALSWHMVAPFEDHAVEFASQPGIWDDLLIPIWPSSKHFRKWPGRKFMIPGAVGTASLIYFAKRHKVEGHNVLAPVRKAAPAPKPSQVAE